MRFAPHTLAFPHFYVMIYLVYGTGTGRYIDYQVSNFEMVSILLFVYPYYIVRVELDFIPHHYVLHTSSVRQL